MYYIINVVALTLSLEAGTADTVFIIFLINKHVVPPPLAHALLPLCRVDKVSLIIHVSFIDCQSYIFPCQLPMRRPLEWLDSSFCTHARNFAV